MLGQPPASPWSEAVGFPPWLAGGVPARVFSNPVLEPACSKETIHNRLACDKNIGWPTLPLPKTGSLCNRNAVGLSFCIFFFISLKLAFHHVIAETGNDDFAHFQSSSAQTGCQKHSEKSALGQRTVGGKALQPTAVTHSSSSNHEPHVLAHRSSEFSFDKARTQLQ